MRKKKTFPEGKKRKECISNLGWLMSEEAMGSWSIVFREVAFRMKPMAFKMVVSYFLSYSGSEQSVYV